MNTYDCGLCESKLHDELLGRLKAGMEKRGIGQFALAKESRVQQGNLSKLLAGKRGCSVETWSKLLEVVESV